MSEGKGVRRLVVIVGPTASGKSALAVKLAKRFGGEVISADSRQVYRGLDIGTNKVPRDRTKNSKLKAKCYLHQGIPHHLLSIVSPRRAFTAAKYQKHARQKISEIWKRGKLPILCGGTGFYIQAAKEGIAMPEVRPNPALRRELAKKSAAELFTILKKTDPARAATIDPQNPRRLIRALEIALALGKVPRLRASPLKAKTLVIGLAPGKRALERNIRRRIREWLRRGLLAEARRLLRTRLPQGRLRELGLVYTWALSLARGAINRATFTEGLARNLLKYAKRQMTWFRRDRRIRWVDTSRDAERYAVRFLKQNSPVWNAGLGSPIRERWRNIWNRPTQGSVVRG